MFAKVLEYARVLAPLLLLVSSPAWGADDKRLWSKRWPDAAKMENKDATGVAHYPGWSLPVLKYLYEDRKITASGHETTDPDPGLATTKEDYSLETYIQSTNHYQIELLRSLDQVPEAGALANLNEGREFLGLGQMATFETFARFVRKHFRLGDAVSFLHAEYQDGPDSGLYVPDNGHLSCEVWGVTRDQQYTVVASVFVSHPNLVSWGPDVRVVESIEALKQDRDYKLLGTCRPDEFNPSLTTFDRLLDTLKLE